MSVPRTSARLRDREPAPARARRAVKRARSPHAGEFASGTPTPHDLTLAQLPVERVRLLVDVWAERYRELGSRAEVAYVYIFENKGEEVGVTLHHPHGQIYALPFIPPFAEAELGAAREHLAEHKQCLHCRELALEASGPRVVLSEGAMVAFVPRSARRPYQVHLYPSRHVASIAELDAGERWDLARALLGVTGTFDRHFGFSTPYAMAVHHAPTDDRQRPHAR